jgi:hypothetical protein
MTVSVTDKKVGAGESSRIHCIFRVPAITGPVHKPVVLTTDEPARTQYVVQVQVEVPPIFRSAPEKLTWTVSESADQKELRLASDAETPVRIQRIECSRDIFNWKLEEVTPGKTYVLRVTPRSTERPALGMFLLHTDSSIPRQKVLSVYAVIQPAS